MSKKRDQKIDEAFKQLEGALCIWARACGETQLKEYCTEMTSGVRRVLIGDEVFEMTLVPIDSDEEDK